MLCDLCEGRTFHSTMMHKAVICQHDVPAVGLKFCEECAKKKGVCEVCGRQVPKQDTDES